MVEFSMGVRLSAEDRELIKNVQEATEVALFLTNDYFSWDRELEYSKKVGAGRLVNAIAVLMKQHNLQAAEAKEMTKNIILQNEAEYVRRRDELYKNYPLLPLYLRKWIEVWGVIIAGNHVWSSTAPRHNDWKSSPERVEKRVQDRLGNQVSTVGTSITGAPSSDEFDDESKDQIAGTLDSSPIVNDSTSMSQKDQYPKESPQSSKRHRSVK